MSTLHCYTEMHPPPSLRFPIQVGGQAKLLYKALQYDTHIKQIKVISGQKEWEQVYMTGIC